MDLIGLKLPDVNTHIHTQRTEICENPYEVSRTTQNVFYSAISMDPDKNKRSLFNHDWQT